MPDKNSKSEWREKQTKLTAVAVICLALAFGAVQIAHCVDAYQTGETPMLILRGLAIVSACAAIVWAVMSIRVRE